MTGSQRVWFVLPVVLTVALAVGYLVVTAYLEQDPLATPAPWIPGALALAQAGLLMFRNRAPVVVLAMVVGLDLAVMITTAAEIGTTSFAVMVAVYALARRRRGRPLWWIAGSAAAVEVVVAAIAGQWSDEIAAGWVVPFALGRAALLVAAPIVAAEAVTGRARLLEALRERAENAERDRERRALEAVQRERTLMARELHDVAAHHLTGIIVSAQAANALLATDPDRARSYLDTVQRDARTTLTNLRQTVGLLRSDARGELAPVPSIEQLPALVEDARETGADIRLDVSGEPVGLGPLAGIAAYRMVQESIANAARHAPGSMTRVEVTYEDAVVRIAVVNGPGGSPPAVSDHDGYGLLGMSERAELIGAKLSTGATAEGGWANILEIPHDGGGE